MPWLYRYGVQNLAQLSRLSGQPNLALFRHALALAPDDEHLRWQAGVAMAEVDQTEEAAMTLQPLIDGSQRHPQVAEVLLASLFDSGQDRSALSYYKQIRPQPPLASGTATRVVAAYVRQEGKVPAEETFQLLGEVFGWSATAAAQRQAAQLQAPGFWASQTGGQIIAAMQWRDQPPVQPSLLVPWAQTIEASTAAALEVKAGSLSLGEELLANGGFEEQDMLTNYPSGWHPALLASGMPWNLGAFVVGADHRYASEGMASLRIDGIFIEHQPDRETATAGLVHPPVMVKADLPYLLSFNYCTADLTDGAPSLFLHNDPQVFMQERGFPGTNGQWRRVIIVGWNRSGHDTMLTPLLRSRSTGSVWFDQVSLRPLLSGTVLAARDPVVTIDEPITTARCIGPPMLQ